MKNKLGFTMFELLVVVLIIGILAAIALPQYQKAVWKSKAAPLQSLISSIGKAGEYYYLVNGNYPTSFDEIDVEVTNTPITFVRKYGEAACWSNLIPYMLKRGNGFEVAFHHVGNMYSVAAYFTTGKYKCMGFVHVFTTGVTSISPLEHKNLCASMHTSNDCNSSQCGGDNFCGKIMNKKYKKYYNTMFLFE